MDVRVFDKYGEELLSDLAEDMVALHGVSWEMPSGLSAGDHYYKLVELREKPSSSLITKVLDLYGDPVVNPDEVMDRSKAHRALWWPTIDSGVGHPIEFPFSTDHHNQADCGGLNANGEGGSGMGSGAWHDPYVPGPHHCWVRHPHVWSMLVKGQGMLGATDHLHLDMTFQEVIYTNGEEPPSGDLLKVAKDIRAYAADAVTLLADIKAILIEDLPGPPPIDQPFIGEYFNNADLSGEPVFVRADLVIDFKWGSGSPDLRIDSDQFSVRWIGKRTFETAGDYRFYTLTDDGIRLWVDSILLIDQWHDQSETQYGATVTLAAGGHDIKMEYYEHGGNATAKLWWEKL